MQLSSNHTHAPGPSVRSDPWDLATAPGGPPGRARRAAQHSCAASGQDVPAIMAEDPSEPQFLFVSLRWGAKLLMDNASVFV